MLQDPEAFWLVSKTNSDLPFLKFQSQKEKL